MKTRTLKEKLRYDIEAATGGHGVYTFELVEEIMKAVNDYEQQVKSVDLADVGGSLLTCTLLEREDVMFGKYKLTSCCKQGPVTQENYCPNCGAKIERQ